MKYKRTVVCNQSACYAQTLKADLALQLVFLGTKAKIEACRHCLSAHAGVLLKLNANTLLGCAFGRHLRKTLAKRKGSKRTTSRHRPSRYAAFGKNSKRTTPRHRPSRYPAFGNRFKRTTPDTVHYFFLAPQVHYFFLALRLFFLALWPLIFF